MCTAAVPAIYEETPPPPRIRNVTPAITSTASIDEDSPGNPSGLNRAFSLEDSYPPIGIFGPPPTELTSNRDRRILSLRREGSWAANKGASHLKKSQQPADLSGDADPDACANVPGFPNRSAQPKWPIGAHINSIQPSVDLQCEGKPPRPSRQVHQFVGLAAPLHQVDSLKRFQCPNNTPAPTPGSSAETLSM